MLLDNKVKGSGRAHCVVCHNRIRKGERCVKAEAYRDSGFCHIVCPTDDSLKEDILLYDSGDIHNACESLGHSTSWESFEKELKSYKLISDLIDLLEELEQEHEEQKYFDKNFFKRFLKDRSKEELKDIKDILKDEMSERCLEEL